MCKKSKCLEQHAQEGSLPPTRRTNSRQLIHRSLALSEQLLDGRPSAGQRELPSFCCAFVAHVSNDAGSVLRLRGALPADGSLDDAGIAPASVQVTFSTGTSRNQLFSLFISNLKRGLPIELVEQALSVFPNIARVSHCQ